MEWILSQWQHLAKNGFNNKGLLISQIRNSEVGTCKRKRWLYSIVKHPITSLSPLPCACEWGFHGRESVSETPTGFPHLTDQTNMPTSRPMTENREHTPKDLLNERIILRWQQKRKKKAHGFNEWGSISDTLSIQFFFLFSTKIIPFSNSDSATH